MTVKKIYQSCLELQLKKNEDFKQYFYQIEVDRDLFSQKTGVLTLTLTGNLNY
jgi:hypothetical protein